MLTCIVCAKKDGSVAHQEDHVPAPKAKHGIKAFRAQIKGMAIKASGAYKKSKAGSGVSDQEHNHGPGKSYAFSDAGSEPAKYQYSFSRTGSSNSTPRVWGKELEQKSRGFSSGELTPASVSSRMEVLVLEEEEPKEWVAQVEHGVLITFVSMPGGGNDLKRIRFSREKFDKAEAQRWWAENYDRVMELYNVQKLNQQAVPISNPPISEDETLKTEPANESQTPRLRKKSPPRDFHCTSIMEYSSSDSLDQHSLQSVGHASTAKLSNISGAKTDASSIDGSARTSSWREGDGYSAGASLSNVSDIETEWVQQDEPGVYITIKALPDGTRELRRVRFSREKFGENQARIWWEDNKARIQQQYL